MMDLSNSSWMTTNGRFRQVSWKADERVKPPHALSSEPPPDQEPQFSCADTKGISSSAHPPPGPQQWAQAHETHTQRGQGDGCTHTTQPAILGVPEGLLSRYGARAAEEEAAKAGPGTVQPQGGPAPCVYPGSAGAVPCTSWAHTALDQAPGHHY